MQDGKKDGLGTYWWPTGASYKGEWSDGSMHGVGTFESPDGTRYQGGWARDLKQGLGKKWFPNGDTYEATFPTDVCFGQLLLASGCIGFANVEGAHIVQLPHPRLPLMSKDGYDPVQSCANKHVTLQTLHTAAIAWLFSYLHTLSFVPLSMADC